MTFLVQVSKSYKLVLFAGACAPGTHLAFDGPGVLSQKIMLSEGTHLLSSFQCILLELFNISNRNNCTTSFVSRQLYTQWKNSIYATQNLTLLSVRDVCERSPCKIVFNDKNANSLNFTIIDLALFSKETLSCRYGALYVESIGDKDMQNTFCKNNSSSSSPSISVYLKHAMGLFVLYWYNSHTEIAASVSLSVTDCNVTIYESCSDPFLSQMAGSVSKVDLSWQYLQKYIDSLKLTAVEEESFKVHYQVLFESSCTVWQIRHNTYISKTGPVSCLCAVQPSFLLLANVRVLLVGNIKNNMILRGTYIPPPNQFCFSKGKAIQCKSDVHKFTKTRFDDPFVLLTYSGGRGTSVLVQSIYFFINLPGKTDQWMDLTIQTHSVRTESHISGSFPEGLSKYFQKSLSVGTFTPLQTPSVSTTLFLHQHFGFTDYSVKNQGDLFHMLWCIAFTRSKYPLIFMSLPLTPLNNLQAVQTHASFSYLFLTDRSSAVSAFLHKENETKSFDANSVSSCTQCTDAFPMHNCYNTITAFSHQGQPKNILLLVRSKHSQSTNNTAELHSWLDAYHLCERYDGHLPSIFSQTDVTHITTVVMHIFPTIPVEALYIGLLWNTKVSFQLCALSQVCVACAVYLC